MAPKSKAAAKPRRDAQRRDAHQSSPAAAQIVADIEDVVRRLSNPRWLDELRRRGVGSVDAIHDSIIGPANRVSLDLQLPTSLFVTLRDALFNNESTPEPQWTLLKGVATVILGRNYSARPKVGRWCQGRGSPF